MGEAQRTQDALGTSVVVVNDRLDALQPHLVEAKRDDGRQRLAHDTLPPVGAPQLVAHLGAMETLIKVEQPARADYLVGAFTCDAPANAVAPGVPFLLAANQLARLVERAVRQIAIILHHGLIRERGEERLRVARCDLP